MAVAVACATAGVTGLTLHDLRHEALSRQAAAGLTIGELQQQSGHRTAQILLRYVNAAPRMLAESLARDKTAMTTEVKRVGKKWFLHPPGSPPNEFLKREDANIEVAKRNLKEKHDNEELESQEKKRKSPPEDGGTGYR